MSAFLRTSYWLVLIAGAIAQAFLGADPVVLGVMVVICCFEPAIVRGQPMRSSDVMMLGLIMYSGYFPILIKTALGQAVDENLSDPVNSSIVHFLGFASVFVGYLLSYRFTAVSPFISNLAAVLTDDKKLKACAVVCFPIGAAVTVAHIILRPAASQVSVDAGDSVGFLGNFSFIANFALICQAAYAFGLGGGRRRGMVFLSVMLLTFMVLSVLGNVKYIFVSCILSIIFIIIFSRHTVNVAKEAVVGAIIFFVLAFYISPIIHLSRDASTTQTISERVELALGWLDRVDYNPFELQERAEAKLAVYGSFRDPSLNYLFPSTANLDRFCIIQPVDQVVSRSEFFGIQGFESFQGLASSILPSFLVDKLAASSPDFIAWYYGIRTPGVVGRPVIGLTASSFAVGGYPAAIFLPGLIMFGAFYLVNRFSGPLKGNVVGVFMLGVCLGLIEKEAAEIIAFFARQFLIVLAFLFIVRQALGLVTAQSVSAMPTRVSLKR
ncbi:hypothetical protein [Xanthobacter aminoxidans]|uniref:Oligosaccharide repeat unit polymerase n=1 Tax=Xanthobacter aminoxidans TaxID=186280 RepID=A0ABW6ZE03_9HYPH